jgi:glycine/D-amino acid oxidase-like deaminating enzyme
VHEVVAFGHNHGIGDACHLGGTISLARTRPQIERLRARVAELERFGFAGDYEWIDAEEARRACNATDVLGAIRTRTCATVHPLRLTHAVARAADAAGARIVEHTAVEEIGTRQLTTAGGTIHAEVVVRATEGYTAQFDGERRALLPIYSLMIATEPLADELWDEIGLAERPTFHDGRRLIIYGQRTIDGRIAFGGRGAPYHFGSKVRPEFDTDERVRELLTDSLRELFPVLQGTAITHHWGGVLAAPRDWTPFVRYDKTAGVATAGGYVGDGVATTHLAGRTLAALITGSTAGGDDELIRLPWVGHKSRSWEPEPLRWLGVNGTRMAAARSDKAESRTDRASRLWGGVIDTVLGKH